MRILVLSEGRHESGNWIGGGVFTCDGAVPALPRLVHRLLQRDDISFSCERLHDVRAQRGKGNRWGRKVKAAIRHASAQGFDAAIVVVDRDGCHDADRQVPMRLAKDELDADGSLARCAVGTPVESFDAWMIADADAIEAAGGDKSKACLAPEDLAHPKDRADEVFDTVDGKGLGAKYPIVAQCADLEMLEHWCPRGFKPFAQDVKAIRPGGA